MPEYRRSLTPGATFFFTVALANRKDNTLVDQIDALRVGYTATARRHPFKTIAICVLPSHLHALWELPADDHAYSMRWALIKSAFSRRQAVAPTRSKSKIAKREKGVWQRRFWEHQIRDNTDLQRHVDYIHYNPVKHGLVRCAADWPHSSFHRYVERGWLGADWGGIAMKQIVGTYGEPE